MARRMMKGRRRRDRVRDWSSGPECPIRACSWPNSAASVSVRVSANSLGLLAVDLLELGVVDLGRQAVEDQLSLVQGDRSIGVLVDQIEEMEGAEDCDTVVTVDRLEIAHDRVRQHRIEGCYRLVGEDHLRVLHQGSGDSHPLLLSPRQL